MTDREKVINALYCRAFCPVVDCEGCVYREKLFKRYGCNFQQICKDALELLKEQKKHGHWIIQSFDATCSECNTSICFDVDLSELDDVIETMDLYYCPHCGSKMEKAVVDI